MSGSDQLIDDLLDISRVVSGTIRLDLNDADRVVAPEQVHRVVMEAHEPKALWIVPGATHGDYAVVAGDEYRDRLVGFVDRALGREAP